MHDLLVVGTPAVENVRWRADVASEQLGRDVNVTVLTRTEWSNATSGFVGHVRASPLVALDLASGDDVGPVPRVPA